MKVQTTEMKKIIIVNNNMKIGGVQKSLYNLLWTIEGKYDITLCLFKKSGAYVEQLPPSVRVIETRGAYRYLGMAQQECRGVDFLFRGALAALCRVFGRTRVLQHFKCRMPELDARYDCAISFLHNGRPKSFYGGVQDFVLHCVKADKKVSFLHGDYRNCGSNYSANNRQMDLFDQIAACSNGCRAALVETLPHLEDRCVTVKNCHRFEEIRRLSQQNPLVYDESFVNVVLVARLSAEKGIGRAIEALAFAKERGARAKLHIIGGGGEQDALKALANERNLGNFVIFYGEQGNPYRYMKNADLLLMTSYHEAAPMVIDEARSLAIPVLTTETTSAREMVLDMACGWICENAQVALNETLSKILQDRQAIMKVRDALRNTSPSNQKALAQFDHIVQ